jgi:glucokinase
VAATLVLAGDIGGTKTHLGLFNADQSSLLAFLAHEFGHVSVERVLSGPGLHNIYRYLLTSMKNEEPSWLADLIRKGDPPAIISEMALADRDPRCVRVLELFVAIYGAEASNLALKYLSMGGLYLCGGIAPKIKAFLQRPTFLVGFLAKGRLRPTLERIPVRISLNTSTALLGAAAYAANTLV